MTVNRLRLAILLTTVGLFLAPVGAAAASDSVLGRPAFGPDFDDDGYADLAIFVNEDAHGAVSVLYGGPDGLSADRNQLLTQDTPGMLGVAEQQDDFGSALAWGDFDGDGFDDLAAGIPGEPSTVTGKFGAGAVAVIFGSENGLAVEGNQLWSQDSPGVIGIGRASDAFGTALSGRRFDADPYADLVIGVPGEDEPRDSGALAVLYGGPDGLAADRNQLLRQPLSEPRRQERFGFEIIGGHLDIGDQIFDIAVAGRDKVGGAELAGSVTVMFGSLAGLTTAGAQRFTQNSPGVEDVAEPNDVFGVALAINDINGDGASDLAIGVLGEDSWTGAVAVLYGAETGLTTDDDQFWTQDSPGVLGEGEPGEEFGHDLVLGDFDDDGFGDLAVGVPHDYLDDILGIRSGAVNVLLGSPLGITADSDQRWTQDSDGVEGVAGSSDQLGRSLTRGDFNGDRVTDLAIGISGEMDSAGAVAVLYAGSDGLTADHDQLWHQGSQGVLDDPEPQDQFGPSLVGR